MRDLRTGRLRVLEQSPDGRLFDAQAVSSIGVQASQLDNNAQPTLEPGAFFVDGSYGVRINTWNSLAGVVVTVRMRFLGSDGRIRDNEWTNTPNTNRTKATSDFPLGVGFPLNITAFASSGAPRVGQTFVQVQLISGLGGATTLLGTLLQDYVTSVQALAWPGSPIRNSLESLPLVRSIVGSAPAAGAQISETCPTGARWRILSVLATFASSVAVANRLARLQVLNSALLSSQGSMNNSIVASQNWTLEWAPNKPLVWDATSLAGQTSIPLETTLLGGDTFQTVVINMQGADQWGAPNYLVQEWLEAAS